MRPLPGRLSNTVSARETARQGARRRALQVPPPKQHFLSSLSPAGQTNRTNWLSPIPNSNQSQGLYNSKNSNSNSNKFKHTHRWNQKFDFVMVPAGAALLATVRDRTTVLERVATLRFGAVSEDM